MDLPGDHIIEFPDPLAVLYHGEVIADAEVDEYKTSADTPLRMSLHARDTPAFTAFASSILCDDHIQVTLEAHKFRFYPRKSVERPADWHYVYEALLRKDLTFEAGLHAFRENVALSDLKILQSGSDDKETYLESSVNVSIFNTSRFSCAADLAVGVYFGNTKELRLRRQNPDVHELKWRFRPMNPANQEVQMLLEQHFTTKQQLPVVISVENISATICGRLFNLPRFKINSHIEGLGINLVKHVDVHIGAFGLLTQRKVSFEFTFSNPINAPLELCDIELDVIVKGIRIANVKHHFGENSKSFRIDKKGEAKSPKISNAYLVASYLKTVQLVTDSSACLDIEVKSAAIKIDHYDLQGLTFNMKNIPFKQTSGIEAGRRAKEFGGVTSLTPAPFQNPHRKGDILFIIKYEMNFVNLPPELLAYILAYLPLPGLAACLSVNRRLHDIIVSDVLLQYIVELRAAGVENNSSPSCRLTIADRLRMLRQREQAWECLEFGRITSIPVKHNPSGIYDLTGGLFLLGESRSPTRTGTDALHFVRLLSAISDSEESEGEYIAADAKWSRIDLGAHIVDIGLAVQEHDLIAIVTYKYWTPMSSNFMAAIDVHLMKLSSGEYHPAASHGTIHVADIPFAPGYCSVSVEIVGHTMGILLNFLKDEEVIYNAFAFLAPDIIVAPNIESNTLDICRIPLGNEPEGTEPSALVPACRLALPPLQANCVWFGIWCRSEPNPIVPGSGAFDRGSNPFYSDSAEAIMLFNFMAVDASQIMRLFSMVVHRSSLLAQLPPLSEVQLPTNNEEPALPPEIDWDAWGPPLCRWFDTNDLSTRWITTTCGQRYVTQGPQDLATIMVLDFNQKAIRRSLSRRGFLQSPSAPMQVRKVLSSDPVSDITVSYEIGGGELESRVFVSPVKSYLPYMAVTKKKDYEYNSVMLDEGVLIGLQLDDESDIEKLVVHSIAPLTLG
ncbi:hypothetical protein IEO21_09405 [Rhodonia placenta]|uniref:F-box domain-containing protein n=1 Tax=Rhodonia placenta TaxID=104341 RepID=A0A8H7NUG9_9APHY|nr:hypothetical protein IEO21_09405 [Postia placenta]